MAKLLLLLQPCCGVKYLRHLTSSHLPWDAFLGGERLVHGRLSLLFTGCKLPSGFSLRGSSSHGPSQVSDRFVLAGLSPFHVSLWTSRSRRLILSGEGHSEISPTGKYSKNTFWFP